MSRIRPLDRADLPAVADLYELVIRSERPTAAPGLRAYFEQLAFDHPFVDAEIPSLVFEEPGEGIVGFLGSHVRPFAFGDRALRIACSGQLVAHPAFRSRGVGALLMRSYLAGPQDLTLTDGATEEVRAIWERLGGTTNVAASTAWIRPLAPTGWVGNEITLRRGWDLRPATRLFAAVDSVAARSLRLPPRRSTSRSATAAEILQSVERLSRRFPLHPAYDETGLAWLLEQAAAVARRGPLVRRIVYDADGDAIGWYIAFLPAGGIGQALEVGGAGPDLGTVLDELFHDAVAHDAVAVEGRLDPYLAPYVRDRRCLLRPSSWALVSSREDDLLATVLGGRALLTRLDGEWWMGHHILDAAELAQATVAAARSVAADR